MSDILDKLPLKWGILKIVHPMLQEVRSTAGQPPGLLQGVYEEATHVLGSPILGNRHPVMAPNQRKVNCLGRCHPLFDSRSLNVPFNITEKQT